MRRPDAPAAHVFEGPKPEWAVALDKMRDHQGNEIEGDATLSSAEAIAFVRHYLAVSAQVELLRKFVSYTLDADEEWHRGGAAGFVSHASSPVPFGQHPATHSVWTWLDENRDRIGPEAADDIDVLLRGLSSELWRLDRGR